MAKIFQKVPKNALFGPFFQKIACGAENLVKWGFHSDFGEDLKLCNKKPDKKCDTHLKRSFFFGNPFFYLMKPETIKTNSYTVYLTVNNFCLHLKRLIDLNLVSP